MEKLISLSEFIKINEYPNNHEEAQSELVLIDNFYKKVTRYNDFLKQPLTLGMFVPCKLVDGVWVVLEEPYNDVHNDQYYLCALDEYEKTKERVLFDGFELNKINHDNFRESISKDGIFHPMWFHREKGWIISQGILNIEDLVDYNLVLAESAKKQIGL